MKNVWIILLSIFVGVLLNTMLTKRGQPEKIEIVRSDTVTVVKTDTVIYYEPKIVVERVLDSVVVRVKDTVYITLPKVVREYKGEDYHAKISGIDPKLDYIKTFPRTEYKYITQTELVREKPKKWVIYANVDYMYATKDFQTLPISIGLSYTPKKAEFHIEYGKELINGVEFVKVGTKIPLILF